MHPSNPANRNVKTTSVTRGYKTATNTWIDKKDVLDKMQISQRTLQKWRSKGILPYYNIEGRIYYREGDLEAVLEQHKCVGVKKKK